MIINSEIFPDTDDELLLTVVLQKHYNIHMQKAMQEHSIVWIPYAEDSEIARQVGAPGDIELPFLVSGEESLKLNRGEGASVSEFNLLLGLLVEYFTPPMSATHKIKPYFKDILMGLLEQFRRQYGYDSIEQCVMVISAHLKEENGESVSRRALKAGLEVVPGSMRIKSALSQMEAAEDA